MAGEMLAPRLHTLHNLHYYMELMAGMREAIRAKRFREYREAFYASRAGAEERPPEEGEG